MNVNERTIYNNRRGFGRTKKWRKVMGKRGKKLYYDLFPPVSIRLFNFCSNFAIRSSKQVSVAHRCGLLDRGSYDFSVVVVASSISIPPAVAAAPRLPAVFVSNSVAQMCALLRLCIFALHLHWLATLPCFHTHFQHLSAWHFSTDS